jgi:3-oxoacyl-[acyl-carrier protein] reductase
MSRILLVTGASSDLGMALIRRIVSEFDIVLCHYWRSKTKIEALSSQFGDVIIPLPADCSQPEDVERMALEIAGRNISPTHFAHLPAIPNTNLNFHKTAWPDYEAQLTVQVRSAHILCKSFLPVMAKERFGRLVFVLTENVARETIGKYAAPYTTAKFALLGLLKCLSAEYADKGITVNGVSPSMIDTAFVSNLPEISRQLNAEKSPLKRNLKVEDVIPILEFLLSDGANMITGQNIAVMGGK